MAKWRVGLVSKESDRTFVYEVAFSGEATDEEVFNAALACHGQHILLGSVDEIVHDDRGSVEQVG